MAFAVAASAAAQQPAGQAPAPAPPPRYDWTGPRPGEQAYTVAAIPGVIAAGARWDVVLAGFNNIDGVVGAPDGGVLYAQEQNHTIRKVGPDGRESVYVADTHGAGSASLDAQGRLFAVQRTCTDPGLRLGPACQELTMVSQMLPERRMLVNSFPDGRPLGRVNDLVAEGKGGAYFTSGGAWHARADGRLETVADQDIRSNGIMLSRDGRTLYVTNNTNVLAFAVAQDGGTSGRRVFAELDAAGGGDGMAIDGEGRLYVTANSGIHVFAEDGRKLGLIPTPRRPITLAFSGADKKTLYLVGNGAVGPDGQPWTTPEGVRNTAMTLYRISMLAQGFMGRPK
jgi:gluconolactonase